MFDATEFQRWMEAARQAREAAEVQSTAGHHNWSCFLAEQAAQLALKSLLHGIGVGAWGHDLGELGRRLSDELRESPPDDLEAALRRLSRHYIPARYPDAHAAGSPGGHYGSDDSTQALRDADLVFDFVESIWQVLLAESGSENGR